MTDQMVPTPEAQAAVAAVQEQAVQMALRRLSLEATQACLQAVKVAGQVAAAAEDSREMDEAAKAALNFAQAIVLLDPSVTTSGTPLEDEIARASGQQDHEVRLEELHHEHAMELESEKRKTAAAAPTPRKSITVKRDAQGRASSYEG